MAALILVWDCWSWVCFGFLAWKEEIPQHPHRDLGQHLLIIDKCIISVPRGVKKDFNCPQEVRFAPKWVLYHIWGEHLVCRPLWTMELQGQGSWPWPLCWLWWGWNEIMQVKLLAPGSGNTCSVLAAVAVIFRCGFKRWTRDCQQRDECPVRGRHLVYASVVNKLLEALAFIFRAWVDSDGNRQILPLTVSVIILVLWVNR